jgi:coenzyme F420-reducing hydrogenase delta subunit
LYARKLVLYLQDIMETLGLDRERLQVVFVSAAEGERFRQICIDMDAIIRKLGPNPLLNIQASRT